MKMQATALENLPHSSWMPLSEQVTGNSFKLSFLIINKEHLRFIFTTLLPLYFLLFYSYFKQF